MKELPKNYNFEKCEQYWRNFWDKEKIYQFDENSDKEIFSVDTPPPYVSAEHLHAGHIMSYSQAEFVVRYKRMQGYSVYYPMGFDDNGLPTERYVEKKYKVDKSKIKRDEFIKLCLKETDIGIQNYKDLWMALGISVDWSKTYSTINNHSRKISQWSFIDLYKKGLVKQLEQPVYWCPRCQTALAQAELDDNEQKSKLNIINFKSEDGGNLQIATSRPELLPACVALFVNPEDKRYKDLIGKKAQVPLFGHKVPILSDNEVDMEFGTGLMMVCTWGDSEDVIRWKENKLETRIIINERGLLTELAGDYKGMNIEEAREAVIGELKKEKLLVRQEDIIHVLNTHDRCNTPAEFVMTKQWFISVVDNKDKFLKSGDELNWFPRHMKSRFDDWVKALKWDWCISRDRYYGVQFPVWYCKDCEEVILPEEKDLPIDPTIDKPKRKCKCGSGDYIAESNVMDTWMTSSMSPLIISKLVNNKIVQDKLYPASLRPQAFEIIRTWLFYTVVKSQYHHNTLPFKDVMISGHGLDGKGRKISKSLGNFKDPNKIITQYGADALRYWATGAKLGENMRYNEQEIQKGKRTVTKLWNAAKFAISFLKDMDPKINNIKLEDADKWVLSKLNICISRVGIEFEHYSYSKARDIIDKFFWNTFADNYMEFIKYRLYSEEIEMKESRKAAQHTLYNVLLTIIKLYAPILPFITEEVYQMFFKEIEGDKSIHLSKWPKESVDWITKENFDIDFMKALNVIERVRKYKSDNQISQGKEIGEYKIEGDRPDKKYDEFIMNVVRVNKLK